MLVNLSKRVARHWTVFQCGVSTIHSYVNTHTQKTRTQCVTHTLHYINVIRWNLINWLSHYWRLFKVNSNDHTNGTHDSNKIAIFLWCDRLYTSLIFQADTFNYAFILQHRQQMMLSYVNFDGVLNGRKIYRNGRIRSKSECLWKKAETFK